jgi:ATP-dependent helicase HrpA
LLGSGTDLAALAGQLAPRTAQSLGAVAAEVGPDVRRRGLRTWAPGEPDDLPDRIEVTRAGSVVRGYPALVDEGDSVAVQVFGSAQEAAASHAAGLRRLVALDLPSPATAVLRTLTNQQRLAIGAPPHTGGTAALLADCLDAVLDDLVDGVTGSAPTQVRGASAYAGLLAQVRPQVAAAFTEVLVQVAALLTLAQEVRSQLRGLSSLVLLPALTDVQAQLAELLPDGFVSRAGVRRVADLSRYLRAIQARLDRLPDRPRPDDAAMSQVHDVEAEARQSIARLPGSRRHSPAAADIGWMLQELRVSLFAPTVRTAYPISDKRIRRALAALADD